MSCVAAGSRSGPQSARKSQATAATSHYANSAREATGQAIIPSHGRRGRAAFGRRIIATSFTITFTRHSKKASPGIEEASDLRNW